MDGTVTSLALKVGESVTAAQAVVTIADLRTWVIKTDDLTELDVVDVTVGQPVKIRFDALPEKVLEGKVLDIALRSEEKRGDQTFTVTVLLTETELRGLLGMMGLSGDKVFQDAGTLSGGEKTKLALAMLMVGRNNLLLLDEPTNNLDPPSRRAVADSLQTWPGSIIFVSHDTEFVTELAPTKVLLMPDGDLDYFSDDWLELVSLA